MPDFGHVGVLIPKKVAQTPTHVWATFLGMRKSPETDFQGCSVSQKSMVESIPEPAGLVAPGLMALKLGVSSSWKGCGRGPPSLPHAGSCLDRHPQSPCAANKEERAATQLESDAGSRAVRYHHH